MLVWNTTQSSLHCLTHSFTHSGLSDPSTDVMATQNGCSHTSLPHTYNKVRDINFTNMTHPMWNVLSGNANKYFTGHHHKVQIWVQTWIPVSGTHLDYQWWKWADTIWRQRRAKCKKLIVIEAQFNVFTGYSYQYLPNCISNYMDSKPIGNNLLCTGETSFHIVINLFLWNVLTNIKAELLCSVR